MNPAKLVLCNVLKGLNKETLKGLCTFKKKYCV